MDTLATYVPASILSYLLDQDDFDDPPTPPFKQIYTTCVMFADVSGFTALCEAMSAKGPIGDEYLAKYLNSYFELLVKTVSSQGGDVFKFAGDAMIVLWPPSSDDLATRTRRAGQCALEINDKMQDVRFEDTISLSIKVGVGVGKVAILHVGGEHGRMEYLATGEPLVQAFDAEHQATKAGVVMSPGAWSLVKEYFTATVTDGGHAFLSGCSQRLSKVGVVKTTAHNKDVNGAVLKKIMNYVPTSVLPWVNNHEEKWASELRRIVVLFINLGMKEADLVDISSQRDVALAKVQRVLSVVQYSINRYEGSLNKFLMDDKGSTLIAVFGLPPLAHEDDCVRGILTALSICAGLQTMFLQPSVGITTGPAFCGVVGSRGRREYSVLGDTVNLSARLMQHATKNNGGVVCDLNTQYASRDRFDFEALGKINVKGKKEQISIFRPQHKVQSKDPWSVMQQRGNFQEQGQSRTKLFAPLLGSSLPPPPPPPSANPGSPPPPPARAKLDVAREEAKAMAELKAHFQKVDTGSSPDMQKPRHLQLMGEIRARAGGVNGSKVAPPPRHRSAQHERTTSQPSRLAPAAPQSSVSRAGTFAVTGDMHGSHSFGVRSETFALGDDQSAGGKLKNKFKKLTLPLSRKKPGHGTMESPSSLQNTSLQSKSFALQGDRGQSMKATMPKPPSHSRDQESTSEGEHAIAEDDDCYMHIMGILGHVDGLTAEPYESSTVMLIGEMGLGKSRMLLAASDRIPSTLQLIWATGDYFDKHHSMSVWRQVFFQLIDSRLAVPEQQSSQPDTLANMRRTLIRSKLKLQGSYGRIALDVLAPVLNDYLPSLEFQENEVTTALDQDARQSHAMNMLVMLLQLFSAATPLVVIIDDAMYLDPASWEFAERLTNECKKGLCLVLSTRPVNKLSFVSGGDTDEVPPAYTRMISARDVTKITLKPREENSIRKIILEHLDVNSCPEPLMKLVVSRANGVPLVVKELLYALKKAGTIVVDRNTRTVSLQDGFLDESKPTTEPIQVPVPITLQTMLSCRLDRLSTLQSMILKVGAVVGQFLGSSKAAEREFSYNALLSVFPLQLDRPSQLDGELAGLVRLGVLKKKLYNNIIPGPSGWEASYVFANTFMPDVVMSRMLTEQQQRLLTKVKAYASNNIKKPFHRHALPQPSLVGPLALRCWQLRTNWVLRWCSLSDDVLTLFVHDADMDAKPVYPDLVLFLRGARLVEPDEDDEDDDEIDDPVSLSRSRNEQYSEADSDDDEEEEEESLKRAGSGVLVEEGEAAEVPDQARTFVLEVTDWMMGGDYRTNPRRFVFGGQREEETEHWLTLLQAACTNKEQRKKSDHTLVPIQKRGSGTSNATERLQQEQAEQFQRSVEDRSTKVVMSAWLESQKQVHTRFVSHWKKRWITLTEDGLYIRKKQISPDHKDYTNPQQVASLAFGEVTVKKRAYDHSKKVYVFQLDCELWCKKGAYQYESRPFVLGCSTEDELTRWLNVITRIINEHKAKRVGEQGDPQTHAPSTPDLNMEGSVGGEGDQSGLTGPKGHLRTRTRYNLLPGTAAPSRQGSMSGLSPGDLSSLAAQSRAVAAAESSSVFVSEPNSAHLEPPMSPSVLLDPESECKDAIVALDNGELSPEATRALLVRLKQHFRRRGSGQRTFRDLVEGVDMDKDSKAWLVHNHSTDRDEQASADNSRRGSLTYIYPTLDSRLLPADFLASLHCWECDIFAVEQSQLTAVAMEIFVRSRTVQELGIPTDALTAFISRVSKRYRAMNPYHNFRHAVDVTQTMFTLLHTPLGAALSHLDRFSLLVASLCHDLDHPAQDNMYQINTRNKLAITYNDKSVLENHHAAETFRIIAHKPSNITRDFSDLQWKSFRKTVIALILATDMTSHFSLVGQLDTVLANGHVTPQHTTVSPAAGTAADPTVTATVPAGVVPESPEEHLMLLQVLLHSSDISNPCKEWVAARLWSDLILKEFLAQGDLERAAGLPVSPNGDRNTMHQATLSLNFIDFIVAPLFVSLRRLLPTLPQPCRHLRRNRENWQALNGQRIQQLGLAEDDANTERRKWQTRAESFKVILVKDGHEYEDEPRSSIQMLRCVRVLSCSSITTVNCHC